MRLSRRSLCSLLTMTRLMSLRANEMSVVISLFYIVQDCNNGIVTSFALLTPHNDSTEHNRHLLYNNSNEYILYLHDN